MSSLSPSYCSFPSGPNFFKRLSTLVSVTSPATHCSPIPIQLPALSPDKTVPAKVTDGCVSLNQIHVLRSTSDLTPQQSDLFLLLQVLCSSLSFYETALCCFPPTSPAALLLQLLSRLTLLFLAHKSGPFFTAQSFHSLFLNNPTHPWLQL